MSSTITETITEPQQAANFIFNLLDANKETLGIGFVGINERLRREYPAVIVLAGLKQKLPHVNHIFLVSMEVQLMVYHGNLNDSHSERTQTDLEMVTAIENLIETDMTFNEGVVFAYISQTFPIPNVRGGNAIVGTQMVVSIESRKGFPYAP